VTSHPPITAFTAIRLDHWKNFPNVDVALGPRAFLVGPNASGKSNFLDAFRFLHDLVTEGGGLDHAARIRGRTRSIRTLTDPTDAPIHLGVSMKNDEETVWSYDLDFYGDQEGRTVVRQERVRQGDLTILERPNAQDRDDPELLTQTALEQVSANRPFRVIAEFFASIRYLHVVPHLIRAAELAADRTNGDLGTEILKELARLPGPTRSARLKRIRTILRAAVPQLRDLEYWRDNMGRPHLRARFGDRGTDESWQIEDRFSDGTLRLFGLIWAALDGDGPLLLEEPELSLNPSIVRLIPAMLFSAQRDARRQIILSTHSAELLMDQGIGLDEVILFQVRDGATIVRPASDFPDVLALLDAGMPLGEIVLPMVSPATSPQLVAAS